MLTIGYLPNPIKIKIEQVKQRESVPIMSEDSTDLKNHPLKQMQFDFHKVHQKRNNEQDNYVVEKILKDM